VSQRLGDGPYILKIRLNLLFFGVGSQLFINQNIQKFIKKLDAFLSRQFWFTLQLGLALR
jgi:hypothetical protein